MKFEKEQLQTFIVQIQICLRTRDQAKNDGNLHMEFVIFFSAGVDLGFEVRGGVGQSQSGEGSGGR